MECAFCIRKAEEITEQLREDDEAKKTIKLCSRHGQIGIRMLSDKCNINKPKKLGEIHTFVPQMMYDKELVCIHIPLVVNPKKMEKEDISVLREFFEDYKEIQKDTDIKMIETKGLAISRSKQGSFTIIHYQSELEPPNWGAGTIKRKVPGDTTSALHLGGIPKLDEGGYKTYHNERDLKVGINAKFLKYVPISIPHKIVFRRIFLGSANGAIWENPVMLKLRNGSEKEFKAKVEYSVYSSRITDTIVDRFLEILIEGSQQDLREIEEDIDKHSSKIIMAIVETKPFLRRYIQYNVYSEIISDLEKPIGYFRGNPIELDHISDIRHLLYGSDLLFYKTHIRLIWSRNALFLFLTSGKHYFVFIKSAQVLLHACQSYKPKLFFPKVSEQALVCYVTFGKVDLKWESHHGSCNPSGFRATIEDYSELIKSLRKYPHVKIPEIVSYDSRRTMGTAITEEEKRGNAFVELDKMCGEGRLWLRNFKITYPITYSKKKKFAKLRNVISFSLNKIRSGMWVIAEDRIGLGYNWPCFEVDEKFAPDPRHPLYQWLNEYHELTCMEYNRAERIRDLCDHLYGTSLSSPIKCPPEIPKILIRERVAFRYILVLPLDLKNCKEIIRIFNDFEEIPPEIMVFMHKDEKSVILQHNVKLGIHLKIRKEEIFGKLICYEDIKAFIRYIGAECEKFTRSSRVKIGA